MTKLALLYITNYLEKVEFARFGTPKIVMTVHDQVDTICPEAYAPTWSETLRDLMEQAGYKDGVAARQALLKKTFPLSNR